MSVEVNSAEDLFNLLAGDDEEVPSSLIRSNSNKKSRVRDTDMDSKQMLRLNKVEEWMKRDDAINSDPREYFEFGMSLYKALLEANSDQSSVPIIQKVTKLMLLWIKLSKSCRVLEPVIQPADIIECFQSLCGSKKLPAPILDVCVKVVSSLLSCSTARLQISPELISEFNSFTKRWAKGTLKVNPEKILSSLPIEFLASLNFPPSHRHFINTRIVEFVIKTLKKSRKLSIDLMSFVNVVSSNQMETDVLRLGAAYIRSGQPVPPEFALWIKSIGSRDPKAPNTSLKNIHLARQIVS